MKEMKMKKKKEKEVIKKKNECDDNYLPLRIFIKEENNYGWHCSCGKWNCSDESRCAECDSLKIFLED